MPVHRSHFHDAVGVGVPVYVAVAVSPLLQSVGNENRHPTAQFAPLAGVDFAAVYPAKSSDCASDGSFLTEYHVVVDLLTDEEIQSGLWVYEN